jgi:DNA repair protein RecO (recombination protein O)
LAPVCGAAIVGGMDWTDEGVMIGARRLGEADAMAELFTRDHGRASGFVHGGAGRRKRSLLEPGNRVALEWKARLEDQLGFFSQFECLAAPSARHMEDPAALAAIASVCDLLRLSTPERAPYPGLYESVQVLFAALDAPSVWPAVYVRWEAGLLSALGYGLDLSVCALTGARDDLAFVSPRSGRAASREAATPYADRLLRLPGFLLAAQNPVAPGDIADGLALTGSFIENRLLAPAQRDMPEARGRLIVTLGRSGRL